MERAVEPVGPGVVGAADRPPDVAGLADELEAAVAAHVVKGPDPPCGVAHQEHRLPGHADRRHVAGPGQLVREAGEDPGLGEDPLVLEREERLARVGRGRQSAGHRPRSLEGGKSLGPEDRMQRRTHGGFPEGARPCRGMWRLSRNWFLNMPIRGHDLDMRDVGPAVDVFVEEVRELGRLVAYDLDEQVEPAAHPHDVDDGGEGVEPPRDRGRGDPRGGLDAEHRIRLVVDGHRVDHRHDAEHPGLAHPRDPVADGPARDTELLRDHVVGRPAVVLEQADDPPVEVVVRRRQWRDGPGGSFAVVGDGRSGRVHGVRDIVLRSRRGRMRRAAVAVKFARTDICCAESSEKVNTNSRNRLRGFVPTCRIRHRDQSSSSEGNT